MKNVSFILALIFLLAIVGCDPKKDRPADDKNVEDVQPIGELDTDIEDVEIEDDTVSEVMDIEDEFDEDVTDTDTEETTDDTEPVMVENEDGSVKEVDEEEIKKEEIKKEHVKKFYIIAGSFQNINNAVNLRQFFKERGYPAMILYPYHGYNRVATGSYPDRASAEKDIKKFRDMNLTYEKEKIEYWLLWR